MKTLFGGILLAIGILIAGASGLCSFLFLIGNLSSIGDLGAVLVFGGPPIAIGLGLAYGGRQLIRSARADAERDGPAE